MATDKTLIIQHLWDTLSSEDPPRTMVLKTDVQEALRWGREAKVTSLDDGNAPNFMKDFLRGNRASTNWPPNLTKLRMTARQVTGRQADGAARIFEFIPFTAEQTEPFPNEIEADATAAPIPLQSISLSLATKSLGRTDESWLVQVAVNLRILEHHFATISPLDVIEITHLQVGVKLGGRSEIDSLFLAVVQYEGSRVNALVTCEAKQARDRILKDQVVQQVVAAYKMVRARGLDIGLVIPIAIKAVPPSGDVFVVEFDCWTSEDAAAPEEELKALSVASKATYRLQPPVEGVGYNAPSSKPGKNKPKL